MSLHELAGKPAPAEILANIPKLIAAYYTGVPDANDPAQAVSFGTSGHRGSSLKNSFNEAHILAIAEAICNCRRAKGIDGPLFLGMDTHALSEPAMISALEVMAAHDVVVMVQQDHGYTPTPVISHAILNYNRGRKKGLADGVVITPSHNPPEDGGFKYNPPEGGPADVETTRLIETQANDLIAEGKEGIHRIPWERAQKTGLIRAYDYVNHYVDELQEIVDLEAIRASGISVGADPMGGAALGYWDPIAERYGIRLTVTNRKVDPTFSFMTVDGDGKIRMDCSSPYAMASLIGLKDRFDIACGNDTDADRHGIVTKAGLMNPNHFLTAAVSYLFQNRPGWPRGAAIGKTTVSTAMIDRVAKDLGRPLY
ncbi:MAG: phosphoglucomutase, alpha-D-glucose phosphate-specific, partial [Smithellaceae bacterium]|nr:phosphoglucomutase, alpha-D-glucose phosphate-specific [Smithellaceae bacterium]